MNNLLKSNNYGHNRLLWNTCVRSNATRRRWYAQRLARSLGDRADGRRQLANTLATESGTLDVPADTGFRVFGPGCFVEVPEIIDAANSLIESSPNGPNKPGGKAFLQEGYLDKETLAADSVFMRFGLRRDLLAAISNYMGVVPILHNVDVWRSDSTPNQYRASQQYHCDWDDITQIKIFIYCAEVDMASGPLTLMSAQASDRLRDAVGYTYDRKRYRVLDEEADALVSQDEQHAVTGGPGTVVLADTSRCFHYGSRVLEGGRPRIVAHYQFVMPTCFLYPPDGYPAHAPYRHLAQQEDDTLLRMVLGAD